jgi:hypothetical protein
VPTGNGRFPDGRTIGIAAAATILTCAVLLPGTVTAQPLPSDCVRSDSAYPVTCTDTSATHDTIDPAEARPSGAHNKASGRPGDRKTRAGGTHGSLPAASVFGFCPAPTDEPLSA